ncbi:hypothetical protein [Macrococcoides canis]|uniref:Uncharacterized protein n=1 Tax=Macrococcoides canis TaxID=1855823 RepID=A0AAE6X4F6_9STAP|nr:hypothetical protein [Macrococcus canis]QCT75483.1 hypothetical protein EST43_09655 [Macrococcus canis]QIH79125.1 hypothetical protein GTN30_10765 [Macrococcus canis]QNR08644.1 hypothetical protein GL258_10495 [Macrococcus canis]
MYQCLVCGFSFLEEQPYDKDYVGSFEICGCCGFQYGYDDYDRPDINYKQLSKEEAVMLSHKIYREEWRQQGFPVFDPSLFDKRDLLNCCLSVVSMNEHLKKRGLL